MTIGFVCLCLCLCDKMVNMSELTRATRESELQLFCHHQVTTLNDDGYRILFFCHQRLHFCARVYLFSSMCVCAIEFISSTNHNDGGNNYNHPHHHHRLSVLCDSINLCVVPFRHTCCCCFLLSFSSSFQPSLSCLCIIKINQINSN